MMQMSLFNVSNGARILAYLQRRGWGQRSADGWRRRRSVNRHMQRQSAEGRQRFEQNIMHHVALWSYTSAIILETQRNATAASTKLSCL